MDRMYRRRFLAALVGLSGLAGTALLPLSRAWAAGGYPADSAARTAMVRLARQLFPHDALPDGVYADIIDRALTDLVSGVDFELALEETEAELVLRAGPGWGDLDDASLVAAMHGVENGPGFLRIREQVRVGIYNGAEFWRQVGYPGPSLPFGGYLHRGAGDIDWLPEEG